MRGTEQTWAEDRAFSEAYAELRRIARRERSQRPAHTLNTTAIVHEAWLKLQRRVTEFQSREHYIATAAIAMRQVLLDYARYRYADKRDSGRQRTLSDPVPAGSDTQADDVKGAVLDRRRVLDSDPDQGATIAELLAIDQALNRLEALDPELARFVELRFFAGLTLDELAQLLGVTVRTATRTWTRARAVLKLLLQEA